MAKLFSKQASRWVLFGIWAVLTAVLFLHPILDLIRLALSDDTSSHVLLIPFLSAWLLYSDKSARKDLLKPPPGFDLLAASPFCFLSLVCGLFAYRCSSCVPKDRLSAYILSLILLWVAGFLFLLGVPKAKASSFALAFLLFAVPIPDFILQRLIYWLQTGSAFIAEIFFNLSGAPVLREGFVFHLPKMSIEVAQECSGIRSSLALLILALLVAHFSFRPIWKKLVFVAAGLCMMLIKNGIRIAALTLLANYVNPDFLYGKLHHQGGIVFFLIGLALLLPVFFYLRKDEQPAVGLTETEAGA
jgi:exosortase